MRRCGQCGPCLTTLAYGPMGRRMKFYLKSSQPQAFHQAWRVNEAARIQNSGFDEVQSLKGQRWPKHLRDHTISFAADRAVVAIVRLLNAGWRHPYTQQARLSIIACSGDSSSCTARAPPQGQLIAHFLKATWATDHQPQAKTSMNIVFIAGHCASQSKA